MRRFCQLLGVAGISACAVMMVRMIIVVIPGGSCGGNNMPSCSPKTTRALETLPISIGGLVFFILFLTFSSALIRSKSARKLSGVTSGYGATSTPASFGGPPPATHADLVNALAQMKATAPPATDHPKWVVPAECPNCGAKIDQATASYADNPVCAYCQAPIPVQPYA
jgi:hypothetical protein